MAEKGTELGADVQSAAALGAVNLVGGDADQVCPQGLGGEGDFEKALDGIGVEQGIGAEPVGELCHLGNGLDGADLVVHHHNAYQNGVRPQGGFQGVQGDEPLRIRLQIGDGVALAFQLLHAVENGVVLNGGGDDVLAPLAQPLHRGEHRPVVGLGAAGGEEYPVRLSTHGGGHAAAGLAKHPGSVDAEIVQSAGIAPVLRQSLGHGRHRLRAGPGGGGIVEINHVL